MNFLGVDLAGSSKNPTGICVFTPPNLIETEILYLDSEILEKVENSKPEVIAIDAPLSSGIRKCDHDLMVYGALPLTLKGMDTLAKRGMTLYSKLGGYNVIEVFSTASSKILGYYDKSSKNVQKKLIGKFTGVDKRNLSKDELDAIFAAITAYLYFEKKTKAVGDEKGKIIIPEI